MSNECVGECCETTWSFDCPCCEGSGEWESGEDCATCNGVGVVWFDKRDRRAVPPLAESDKGGTT